MSFHSIEHNNERSGLLPTSNNARNRTHRKQTVILAWLFAAGLAIVLLAVSVVGPLGFLPISATLMYRNDLDQLEVEGRSYRWVSPVAEERCDWVVDVFTRRNADVPKELLIPQYAKYTESFNVFYRATASIFWLDFAGKDGHWGNLTFNDLGISPELNGVPFNEKALWTWITGDQHLSNFGAWRNRNEEIVFGVNDFDEAAIYDFHIDVIRIAVSVYNHAVTNELSDHHVQKAVFALLETYVDTVMKYVGNDHALVYELTPKTARGPLQDFLENVKEENSFDKQLDKFTVYDGETGTRTLLKSKSTRLEEVPPELEAKIRDAFTSHQYGATMMKMGYMIRPWNDEYYRVLDVARRVGSGVGSYGVDRFYVLLQGSDDKVEGSAIILDVKYEPPPAVAAVLTPDDAAWYDVLFPHPAARAVAAQRALTSYTDPFTGWVMIDGRAFVVRQRSPWKDSPNLDELNGHADFTRFMEQVAIATATSHVRGTVSKSPGQFKHMLTAALSEYSQRKVWRKAVTELARNYHQQVLLDFACFQDFVEEQYTSPER